jgi:hypothetical protein
MARLHGASCCGQLSKRSELTPLALFPQPMATRCRHIRETVISTAGLPARTSIPNFEESVHGLLPVGAPASTWAGGTASTPSTTLPNGELSSLMIWSQPTVLGDASGVADGLW